MLELTKYYYYLFGALTIVGGVIGYIRAHSVISLVAGAIAGALLLVAAYLISTRVQPALILGLLISLALGYQFISAYMRKGGFMPAGLMSALSVIGVILTVAALVVPGKR